MNNNMEVIKTWDLVKHYLKPVAHYFDMPGVTEILINTHDEIYIEKNGNLEKVSACFKNNAEVEKLIEQIGKALDQPVHKDKFPIIDARLPGISGRTGARINGVMTPIAVRGACITIRVFPEKILDADDLLNKGTLTKEMLEFLKVAVLCRSNIIVSGGTGSGKTTLINVLCSFIPKDDRIITIEDTAELQLNTPHRIAVEAPRRRLDEVHDTQQIDMSFLLRNALRQRPDRIIVGEIRSADSAASFLQAINTGHEGCMTTIHANSTADALVRMESLAASQSHGLPYEVIKSQVRGNINLLIQQQRISGQGRRIVEVAEIVDNQFCPLWLWNYKEKNHTACNEITNSQIIKKAQKYSSSDLLQ